MTMINQGRPTHSNGPEEMMKNFFMQAPAAIAILEGLDFTFTLANPLFQKLFGRSHDQLIGHQLREIYPELKGQGIFEMLTQVFETGEAYHGHEFPGTFFDNNNLKSGYYDFVAQPIVNERGVIANIMIHAVDVTERVLARNKIEENEELFKELANAMPQVVWVADANGKVNYYNERVAEFSGAKRLADDHWEWEGLLHEDDLIATQKAWQHAVKTGTAYEIAHRVKMKDGSFHWHLSRAIPQKDADGNIRKWFGTATNIHKQKQIEVQFKESEEHFKQMADLMPQMVWTARPDGYTDYFNRRWYEYTGFEGRELGEPSWVPIIYEEDLQRCLNVWRHAVETETPYEIEYRFKDRKNPGGYRWFLGRALPVRDSEGKVIKWFGTCTDIDDQKNFSERLAVLIAERTAQLQHEKDFIETILNSSNDAIAVFDLNLNYMVGNEKMEQQFQLKKSDYLNKNVLEVFPNLKGSEFVNDIAQCLQGNTIFKHAYRSQIVNRWLQNFYIPLKESDGKVYGAMVVGHDITDIMEATEQIKQANEILQQKNEELLRTNKELESFNYIASHDMQEPLRKIQTFIDLIQRNRENPETSDRYFDRIRFSAQRMSQLIKSVLAYSKLSNSIEDFVPVDLNVVLENIQTDFELLIQEKQATIQYDRLPVIKGIPFQINQLFSNLISNSLKFAQVEPLITVEWSIVKGNEIVNQSGINRDTDYLELRFSDNGIGFEPQFSDQIFKLFQRLHSNEEYSGTGIGLSIVKKIVENHRGVISASSEPLKGAEFFIWLPAQLLLRN